MGKRTKKPADQPGETCTLRITNEFRDDFAELFRRADAAGVDRSTYVRDFLCRALHPDPSGQMAVRELLRELRELTDSLRDRVEKVDLRTKNLRATVAKGVAAILVETADWPLDKAQKWVQEKLLQ
jgi:hypothetical protein